MIIFTIIIFFALLALLILVHEFGHFVVARRAGIRVDEFGLGFPPKVFSFLRKGTRFSLNMIPLGGFVKIYGEEGEGRGEPDSFSSKSVGARIAVVLAGVAMNFLFAAIVLSFGFWYGLPGAVEGDSGLKTRDVRVTIVGVAPNSPAAAAGLKIGDSISAFSTGGLKTEVAETKEAQDFIVAHKGQEITMLIKRGDETIEKKVMPRVEAPEGQGALGVALEKTGIISYSWYRAPIEGVKAVVNLTRLFVSTFYAIIVNLTVHGVMTAEVAGPVGIGVLTYQVTQLGFAYLIQFAAILSINLGIINAFPFPALDGGRAIFLLLEALKGSPVAPKYERVIHTAGFVLLIFLMILVTARDVIKLF